MRCLRSGVYGPCVAMVLQFVCAFSHAEGVRIPTDHAAPLKHDSTSQEVIGRFLAACMSPDQTASKRKVAMDELISHRLSHGSVAAVADLDNWSECCKLTSGSDDTKSITVYPTNISGLFLAEVELVTHPYPGGATTTVYVVLFEMQDQRIAKMTAFFSNGSRCSIEGG
jgi:hypothetical protein